MIPEIKDIPKIIDDRELFEEIVYTPLVMAIDELRIRRRSKKIEEKVNEIINHQLPEPLQEGHPRGIVFRQLVTPNYEMRRFVSLLDMTDYLAPLFFEYHNDKFTSNNDWKHSLGKLEFYSGRGKKGGRKTESVRIIEFNGNLGKKISEVKTFWGQSLIDFHHEFFNKSYKSSYTDSFFDASDWFKKMGSSAEKYYVPFMGLFVRNAILFENFMLDAKELSFTRDIFLPAFIEVFQKTGHKPLIVALEPTKIEGRSFWLSHHFDSKKFLEQKMLMSEVSWSTKKKQALI